jgi:radical SAM superfamily enzyme YgiQ (UPF0313 family)
VSELKENVCSVWGKNLKILLVCPRFPDTFWSFKHALRFISKESTFPPLGLLTVAAMLPNSWQKRLVDMNVTSLRDGDLKWADYVFISAMAVQKESVGTVIKRCKQIGVRMVAGGPLFTSEYEEFADIDHLVLDEAEITLAQFIQDLQNGCANHIYRTSERPDLGITPIPAWELVDLKSYSGLNVQYSRGCPFDCDFCDIIVLNGHKPRTKSKEQFISELEAIYKLGWRSGIFIVDDNFIGNKKKLKEEVLPALIAWMKSRKYPFSFITEASINVADDEELMDLMVQAGFDTLFVGIESPSEECLTECGKTQNKNRDMLISVKTLQNRGFQVHGGFIIGFDSDIATIFENMITFIQRSGIVTAMVGLLNAPTGTKLYQRLKNENRLTRKFSGNNTEISMNFIPKMEYETLINGYKHVLNTIYSPKEYYERATTFLREFQPATQQKVTITMEQCKALIRSIWIIGIKRKGRKYYWKLLVWTLLRRPRFFTLSVTLAVCGFHYRQVVNKIISFPNQKNAYENL